MGEDGLIKTAAVNEPRFDHNPTTGESLGLLVEEQRTNLLNQSQSFSSWSLDNSSLSTNSTVAPDGTLTATKLIESPTNSSHGLTRSYDWVNYTSLVLSVYVKPAERSILSMSGYNSAGDLEFVYFNLSNGTTSNSTKGRIETMRDGWYRCILLTAGGGFGGPRIHLASTPVSQTYQGSSQSYSGDGNSGIYIWGVQYEIGTFPTSYIPTTTSPVTRSIDTVSITGPNFSNWYNQNEGTLFQNVVSRAPIGGPGGSNAGIGAII